jgi:hypothetical protein
MVQRVMGHERASTTLDLYTRRTDDSSRILRARDDYGPEVRSCTPDAFLLRLRALQRRTAWAEALKEPLTRPFACRGDRI